MNLKKAIETLKLKKVRGIEDLKDQFHKLAHQFHPDKNPDQLAHQTFREILEAYSYLLNNLTAVYDHFGLEDEQEDEETVKSVIQNLDDIFDDIFGFSKSGRVLGFQEPQILYLTVEEFVKGVTKKKRMVAYVTCLVCQGVGAPAGQSAKVCSHCFGHGTLPKSPTDKKPKICPKCRGRGRMIAHPCTECNGFGRLKQQHLQKFTVPVGLRANEVYTLEGVDLETKRPTKIFVELRLLRHSIFQIDKTDLLCEYHLDFKDLHSDLKLYLNTPLGKVPLTIPKNAQKGDCYRISGAGLYKDPRKSERGDLVVTLRNRKKSLWSKMFGGWFEK